MLTIFINIGEKERFVNDFIHFYNHSSFLELLTQDKKSVVLGEHDFLEKITDPNVFRFYLNDFNDLVSSSKSLNEFQIINYNASTLLYCPTEGFEKRSKTFTIRYATKRMFPNLSNIFRIIESPFLNSSQIHISHISVKFVNDRWVLDFCNIVDSNGNPEIPEILNKFFASKQNT